MRRLALLWVVVPGLAAAGWVDLPAVTGTPQDVVVADGGTVIATASTAAGQVAIWQVADGGYTVTATQTGPYVGAGTFSGGCVAAATNVGQVNFFPPACGAPQNPGSTIERFRVSPSGLAVGRRSNAGLFSMLSASPPNIPYTGYGGLSAVAPTSLGILRIGALDVAVLNNGASNLMVSVDGGDPSPSAYALASNARDAVPFNRFGRPAALVIYAAGTVGLVTDLFVSASDQPVQLPGGFSPQFASLTTARGSDAGAGYGLMSTVSGQVLSPVPDPSRPGATWLVRSGARPLIGRVHCDDARACAGFGDGGAVYFLSNDQAPVASLDAGTLTAGVPATLTATANDPDGDPVFISWASPASVSPGADPEGRIATLTVASADECTTASVPISLTISDGLQLHDQTVTTTAPVLGQSSAWIAPSSAVVSAGDPPVQLVAGVDAGCSAGAFTWTSSTGQSGVGSTLAWTVPATECAVDGGVQTVSVTWLDQAGHQSTATSTITVAPWGLPLTPVFATPAVQAAGTSQVWGPTDAEHVCAQSPGYPGSQLQWSMQSAPPGVTLTPVDGGLDVAVPDACTSGTVTASAVRAVNGASPSAVSGAGALAVTIVPNPPPLGANTPFGIGLEVDGGVARGFFTVDAGCRDLALLAGVVDLSVPDNGAVVASTGSLPVPGPWSLAIPGSCGAGTFELTARLFDDGGFTGAVVRDVVRANTLPILPGVASPATLPVACGVGGKGQLRVDSAPGGCATPVATWTQTGGPALTQPVSSGAIVDVQTVSTGFDVVGGRLAFEVVVGDGSGATATGTHEVLLTAEPFVEIAESLSPFPAREEESVLVTVLLRNTTTCDVSGLELREALGGLSPVLDTLRLGGAAASGEWVDDTLILRGVSLGASATEDVTFKARRRLLARGTATGVALLGDQTVSFRAPEATGVTGCGCEAGGAPLLALVVLLAGVRRRRRGLV